MTNRDYIMNISVKDFINEYCLPVGYTEKDFVRLLILFKADNEKINKWLDSEMIGGRKLTNAERIKSMTTDELTIFLYNAIHNNQSCQMCIFNQIPSCSAFSCKEGYKAWLQCEAVK